MFINSVGLGCRFSGRISSYDKAAKIVRRVMGDNARVKFNTNAMKITIPGKKGSIMVSANEPCDMVDLALDFEKVQTAKRNGLIKVEHVTKIGL